jgi:iron complex transport system ATP-binding protein
MTNSLECGNLVISVAGRMLVRDLQLSIDAGTFVCILGRNGVGKTLTLHTLAGLRPVLTGTVSLAGKAIVNLSRRQIAQRLGLLLQVQDDTFPVTVIESALMGRHSHLGFWQWESQQDRLIAMDALKVFGLSGLEQRTILTLSGGERRRVALATLLVQNPDIWLLDEPTNHLDPHHQLDVLGKLSGLARSGKCVIATLHDPTLAARFSNYVLLLHGDGDWEFGPTNDLLVPTNLERLYGTPFESFHKDDRTIMVPA